MHSLTLSVPKPLINGRSRRAPVATSQNLPGVHARRRFLMLGDIMERLRQRKYFQKIN